MRKISLTRAARYSQSGFLYVEYNVLKQIPLNAPYSKLMRQERLKLARRAVKEGWTKRKFEQAIAQQYNARGWKIEGQRLDKSAIFNMVRDYEARWRESAPPDEREKWVSPSAKKSHHIGEFNRNKALKAKREYNARPEVREKRRLYRLKNRDKIREAERKRRKFNAGQERLGR